MNKPYISRVKHKIFPLISDWSDPMDKFRFEKDVNKLSQRDWFWFHPSSYKLIIYGSPIITITFMVALAIFLSFKGLTGLAAIPLIIIVVSAADLLRKLKNKKHNKYTNMYDIYMREYEEETIEVN